MDNGSMRPRKRGNATSVWGFGWVGEPGGELVMIGDAGLEGLLTGGEAIRGGREFWWMVAAEGVIGERRSVGGDMIGEEGDAIGVTAVSSISFVGS